MGQGSEPCGVPYWIGEAKHQGAGLRIDPERRTVTLSSGSRQRNRRVGLGEHGRI